MKKKIQKPFNVEAAKRGAKVETRNGIPVRIICYDREGGQYPILALVDDGSGYESCIEYDLEGKFFCSGPSKHDLVIVEEVECPEYPKFKVGDWIIATNAEHLHHWLITAVTSYCYELQDIQGRKGSISQIIVDNYSRLWTLKDAKPGDILARKDGKRPFILKALNSKDYPIAYCGIDSTNSIFISENPWTTAPIRPATYDERQQFFNKLEEEGYKWESESFTLSKTQKRWRDNENVPVNGYFIDIDSQIESFSDWNTCINYNLFATEKQAKSALAMAHISQILANDKRFGGPISDEEWDGRSQYSIVRVNKILIVQARPSYEFLSFRTPKQADLFLEENKDLIKDYYMMD